VLIWWGHKRHGEVKDELVNKIVKRVKEDGMGFISLHSSHFAKPNKALMGTACSWGAYVGDSTTLAVHVKDASTRSPRASRTSPSSTASDTAIRTRFRRRTRSSSTASPPLKDGKVDRGQSASPGRFGKGKMFYFQGRPRANPIFYAPTVRKIMLNAVQWAAPKK
jgi:trehalose utilization protein